MYHLLSKLMLLLHDPLTIQFHSVEIKGRTRSWLGTLHLVFPYCSTMRKMTIPAVPDQETSENITVTCFFPSPTDEMSVWTTFLECIGCLCWT